MVLSGTCAGGWKSDSSGPWFFQSCSTDARLGLWQRIWDEDLTPSVPVQVSLENPWLSLVGLCVQRVVAETDWDKICYLHSPWASAAAVWACGSYSWCWSCSPDSLSERASWVEKVNGTTVCLVIAVGWSVSQGEGMGQASASGMARQRPIEYRQKVDAATRCCGTCSQPNPT